MLFEGVEAFDRLVVLDVGSGAQSTVDFFGQYHTHIHFADLLSSPLLAAPPDELDAESACRIFTEHLSLPADVTFDVCLFWDVLHRVDLPVLRGLSQALHPHVHRGTRGYGFGTLHGSTFDHRRYGIRDLEHLTARPIAPEGRFFSHTQKQISDHFASFTIGRATLLRTGRLELLLEAS
jgi:hypothetical protein